VGSSWTGGRLRQGKATAKSPHIFIPFSVSDKPAPTDELAAAK
jgi:hypothetical protein